MPKPPPQQELAGSDHSHLGMRDVRNWLVLLLGTGLTLFQLYTGFYGSYVSLIQGAIHVGAGVALIFLLYSVRGAERASSPAAWYDVALAAAALGTNLYLVVNYERLVTRAIIVGYTELDIAVSVVGVVLVLEATRRSVGLPIVLIALSALAYGVYGAYLPAFSHPGLSWERMITETYLTSSSIFGTPIQVSSTYIYLFLFFGVILVRTRIGAFFSDLAFLATGRYTGGTAKAAVVASGLQGMVSGSSISNTVASGSFTIPMMKRSGFTPEFAAATEASASTGGQIMPPIMGAAAFIMAAYTGVPYIEVMVMAAVPALLYFVGVFAAVHFAAARKRVHGLALEDLPNGWQLVKRSHLLIPLIAILVSLFSGRSPTFAALVGIGSAIAVSLLQRETRLSIRELLLLGEAGARVALPVIAACATAGIIAGTVTKTGLGGEMAQEVLSLSGGSFPAVLILTMLACFALGMGLPTTANYVVTASITAPILVNNFDIPVIAAHMFVFYFGVLADITPPVCLAAYAAAGLAGANPMRTGSLAFLMAMGGFIVPFVFVTEPALLWKGSLTVEFLVVLVTTTVGIISISAGLMGYFLRDLSPVGRAVLIIAGLLLVIPSPWLALGGLGLVAANGAMTIWNNRRRAP